MHTHSTASDGTDTPSAVIAGAAGAGLDVLALTDHDTTGGWDEALAVRPRGLTVVLGAELSCMVDVPALGRRISMHLLAYGFDPEEPALAAERRRMREARVDRVEQWQQMLRDDGYDLSLEPLRRQAEQGTVGRPHFASLLVESGLAPSFEAAFGPEWAGGRYRVPRAGWDVFDAMAKVAGAGGATVFAHPYARLRGAVVGEPEIRAMAAAGLTGIEVDHPDHAPEDRAALRRLADELEIVVTGSSDYHGSRKDQGLGAETTDPRQLERLLAGVTGRLPVTDPV
ncbi:MAG TPA: PHP domain-containing protein [Frankiaceae bacterium]|nr:PHP domain-containing protein [Frankiaceae bacterium]